MAYAGDHDGALAFLDEKRTWLPRIGQPNPMGSWWMLVLVIEGLVMLGEQSQAGQLYPLARELIGTGAVALWPISASRIRSRVWPRQRHIGGKLLKSIFRPRCNGPSPFPIVSSKRRYAASTQ